MVMMYVNFNIVDKRKYMHIHAYTCICSCVHIVYLTDAFMIIYEEN